LADNKIEIRTLLDRYIKLVIVYGMSDGSGATGYTLLNDSTKSLIEENIDNTEFIKDLIKEIIDEIITDDIRHDRVTETKAEEYNYVIETKEEQHDSEVADMPTEINKKIQTIQDKINDIKEKISTELPQEELQTIHCLLEDVVDVIKNTNNGNIFQCLICGEICHDTIELSDHITIQHENTFYAQFPPENSRRIIGSFGQKKGVINCTTDDVISEYSGEENVAEINGENTPYSENGEEDEESEEIYADPYGRYQCDICKDKFTTPNHLGEHFTLKHNNYSDQLILDDRKVKDGFPGFPILEYIRMIQINSEQPDEICPICSETYGIKLEGGDNLGGYRLEDFDDFDNFMDGAEKSFRRSNSCPCLISLIKTPVQNIYEMVEFVQDQIAEEQVVEEPVVEEQIVEEQIVEEPVVQNHIVEESVLQNHIVEEPVVQNHIVEEQVQEIKKSASVIDRQSCKLHCCQALICKKCLRSHVEYMNNIICPFCKYDHNDYESLYVTYFVESDECDKLNWSSWWKKHIDIFC